MGDRISKSGNGPPVWLVVLALALGCLAAFGAAWIVRDPGPADTHQRPVWSLDRLHGALMRCQKLGDRALDDPRCRAAWAEHRRRFLDIQNMAEPRQ